MTSLGRKRSGHLGGAESDTKCANVGAMQFSAGSPQGKLAPSGGSVVHEVTSVGTICLMSDFVACSQHVDTDGTDDQKRS